MKSRYSRQIIIPQIGQNGQLKLKKAKVLVIGAGGLGCAVLQNLASAGVGTIGIVDGDMVDITNLHRQILYTQQNVGENKAQAAEKALDKINPDVEIEVFDYFLTKKNWYSIFFNYEIIVDCTDNIPVRYLINDISIAKKKPMIYAGIHQFEGQVSVFNYQEGPSYRCLFPEGDLETPTCEEIGVLGVLPNILGLFQANEVLKIILGIGEILSGKLLLYDALSCQTKIIKYQKNKTEIDKGLQNSKILQEKEFEKTAEQEMDSFTFYEKCKQKEVLKIDLREKYELPKLEMERLLMLPLPHFLTQLDTFDKTQEIVLFCQTGTRSQYAFDFMKQEGFTKVSHLVGGVNELNN